MVGWNPKSHSTIGSCRAVLPSLWIQNLPFANLQLHQLAQRTSVLYALIRSHMLILSVDKICETPVSRWRQMVTGICMIQMVWLGAFRGETRVVVTRHQNTKIILFFLPRTLHFSFFHPSSQCLNTSIGCRGRGFCHSRCMNLRLRIQWSWHTKDHHHATTTTQDIKSWGKPIEFACWCSFAEIAKQIIPPRCWWRENMASYLTPSPNRPSMSWYIRPLGRVTRFMLTTNKGLVIA